MRHSNTGRLQPRVSPLLRALAAGMLLIAVPGVQELVEDAIHLIADGHTAHDAAHAGEQPGHCCSGLFHVCACHPHAVAALATTASVVVAHATQLATRARTHELFRPGFHTQPFRPPAIAG